MRKNALTICGSTCVLGAFGVFLRWVQNQVCFDPETGLAVSGKVWPYLTVLWIVVAAAVLGAQCQRMKNRERTHRPETFAEAFVAERPAAAIAAVCCGVLMAAGSAVLFATVPSSERQQVLLRLLAGFGVLTGIAFPVQLRSTGEEPPPAGTAVAATVPIVLFAFWLVVSYKTHIVNPTISAYSVEILALSAATIAFYQVAGFAYARPKAIRAVFWCQFAAFLCLMTLADSRYTGEQIMLVAAAAMLLLQSWLVVSNIKPIEE